ncbi:hypothetical protein RUM43_005395 [Polyplax serrata]|uniref:Uncharacterized protein n=1 Tax=Polyplax serrata TaxID=468196 RepID=A0AAN8S8M2_POLSC
MAADRDKVNLPEGRDKTDRKTFRQINHFNGPTCVHEWTLTHSTHERCSRAVQKVKEPQKTTKISLSNSARLENSTEVLRVVLKHCERNAR